LFSEKRAKNAFFRVKTGIILCAKNFIKLKQLFYENLQNFIKKSIDSREKTWYKDSMPMPRVVDIAKAAEVSPSAVSLVLNNRNGVSTEVRRKILSIAGKMGYKNVPAFGDQAEQKLSLRLIKIAKHGHVVNDRHNPFIGEYLDGMEAAARTGNCSLEVVFFNQTPIEEIVRTQRDDPVDGLVILGTELNAHELTYFTDLKQAIVFIDTYFPFSIYDCVDMDNADGVFKAVECFYRGGHRSIGLVKSSYETRNFKMREFAFREAMEYFSMPIQEDFIVPVDPAFDQSQADMGRFLAKTRALPTAFFCMNDIIACGVCRALRAKNLSVPGNVSLIGFDDLPSSTIWDPPLTTVRVSTRRIGMRAIEILAGRIRGGPDHIPENIQIPGELILRDSVRSL
jgi:LacI family transcriptional regulator